MWPSDIFLTNNGLRSYGTTLATVNFKQNLNIADTDYVLFWTLNSLILFTQNHSQLNEKKYFRIGSRKIILK